MGGEKKWEWDGESYFDHRNRPGAKKKSPQNWAHGIICLVQLNLGGKYRLQIGGDAYDIFTFRSDHAWDVYPCVAYLSE